MNQVKWASELARKHGNDDAHRIAENMVHNACRVGFYQAALNWLKKNRPKKETTNENI
jgi:aerobic-type carbon monoxide dehydrogenase small subunit (CoxS/CutS family)